MADFDEEDDMPIAELMRRRAEAMARTEGAAKKSVEGKKEKPASKSSNASASKKPARKENDIKKGKSSSSTTNVSSSSSSSKLRPSTTASANTAVNAKIKAFYDETAKGKLIQNILIRWWYGIEWPKVDDIPDPPMGYEILDGFPGVFIGTRTDNLGVILDKRNSKTCPNFKNMKKKTSAELKEICAKCVEGQIAALVEAEGNGTKLQGELQKLLSEVRGVDTEKADRKALKFEKRQE